MIALADVRQYLRTHRVKTDVRKCINTMLNDFRRGSCYLHPIDANSHEEYFSSTEEQIHTLFLTEFTRQTDSLCYRTGLITFDGHPVDLIDLQFLLDRFLRYKHEYYDAQARPPDSETGRPQALANPGSSVWVAYMICHDHEGWLSQALYSTTLQPVEGIGLLSVALRYRLGLLPPET